MHPLVRPGDRVRSDDHRDAVPEAEREALLEIADGAVVTSGGILIFRALTTLTEFALTRGLGPLYYGIYALAWRISQVGFRLVNFGTIASIQRYIPAYDEGDGARGRVAGLAYATTVLVGLIIGAGLVLAADWIDAVTIAEPSFPPTLRLLAAVIVLAGVINVHVGLLRSVGSVRGAVLLNFVVRPGVRLLAVLAALALGYSVVGVAGALVVGVGLLAITSVALTNVRPRVSGTRPATREFYNHAAPLALSHLGKVFQSRIDVVLIGLLVTAEAAGVYNVVLVLIAITWIPLKSFNQLLPPVASGLYAEGDLETLREVYTAITRLIVTFVLPILTYQLVFGRELLAIFGPTFVEGYGPLVVYLGGALIGSAVGATGWLMAMTDHQYARMVLDWLLAVANVALTYLFVLEFGILGAALGTSLAIVVQNLLQVLLLRRFEGLWPFDRSFLTPVAAAIAMAIATWGVRALLDGAFALLLGAVVGVVVYGIVLRTIGLNPRDRLVIAELWTRYRGTISRPVR
jgi:O-antigen/teichoic acid export membrane protein